MGGIEHTGKWKREGKDEGDEEGNRQGNTASGEGMSKWRKDQRRPPSC